MMEIVAVQPGTVIEHDGQRLTVTETQAVSKFGKMYVTPRQLEAIKAHPSVVTKSPESEKAE